MGKIKNGTKTNGIVDNEIMGAGRSITKDSYLRSSTESVEFEINEILKEKRLHLLK